MRDETPDYANYLSLCCDKITNKKELKGERAYCGSQSEVQSKVQTLSRRGLGGSHVAACRIPCTVRKQREMNVSTQLNILLRIQSRTTAHGRVTPTHNLDTSVSPVYELSHRHAHRPVSWVILDTNGQIGDHISRHRDDTSKQEMGLFFPPQHGL